ncbi:MAG TPA: cation:proton antiporter [Gemmatimonadales bacterium]|nr:cation:proton antiporter [Gemmatimonadales bacterium]
MSDAHLFLKDLAVVLGVAAVTTVLFQRLRLPVVLGYLLAGLVVGPHVPIPLVADSTTVRTLSELGIILLMFSLGIEFSLRKLIRRGPRIALVAVLEVGLMLTLGYIAGQLLGWGPLASAFAGAVVAISSTMIVARVLAEERAEPPLRDLVFGVLVVEDLVAILLIAALTALTFQGELSARGVLTTGGRLLAFLAGSFAVGLLVVPPAVRSIVRLRSPETTLVASIGFAFTAALVALWAGYSVALGAFLAGSLVAESGAARQVETLVRPVRDMFAAIFFVAVGMLLDPAVLREQWIVVVVLAAVVLVGKTAGVTAGAFLTGHGTRLSLRAGLSLAQVGEFSFIIAGLTVGLGGASASLPHIAVAVCAITAFIAPLLVRVSEPLALFVDRHLPRPMQTFVTLYGSWVELLRGRKEGATPWAPVRAAGRFVLLDAVLLAGLVIGVSINWPSLVKAIREFGGVTPSRGAWLVLTGAAACAAPFALGLVRSSRRLGHALAEVALPGRGAGKMDPADAPRRAFVVTLQIAVVMVVGLPLIAVTQPFLPPFQGAALAFAALILLGVTFWRTATNLQGHMRAGAEIVAEALGSRKRGGELETLEEVQRMLPGLGRLVPVRVGHASAAAGRSLAELNLRGRTGATAVALRRAGVGGEEQIVFPTARVVLHEGDLLALSGSNESISEAVRLLESGGTAEWRVHDIIGAAPRARDTNSPPSGRDAIAPPDG